jgi:hypothetical protein
MFRSGCGYDFGCVGPGGVGDVGETLGPWSSHDNTISSTATAKAMAVICL